MPDIFDFLESGKFGEQIIPGLISINIPKKDMKELIVVIAINTAVIGSTLREYGHKMSKFDVISLETVLEFGKSTVIALSEITGFSQEELMDELALFINTSKDNAAQQTKVYFNQSKGNLDDFVKDIFGEEGT